MSVGDGLAARYAARPLARFLTIGAVFLVIFLASWPIVLSFDLWVLKDRSCFLNLDYLVDQHLALGVDAAYSYGLLPVLLQRIAFALFGRGYWPMIGWTVLALLAKAAFWARLIGRLPDAKVGLAAVIALSPILLWVNPTFPYSIVELSILFAILAVLEGRWALAMPISVLGWFSVPSLPLALTAVLFLLIVAGWWLDGERAPAVLARRLAPGIGVFVALAALLAAVFGTKSVVTTLLPLSGAAHYRAAHYGLRSLMIFLHPAGHRMSTYLLANRPAWWIASTLALLVFSLWAARDMARERSLEPRKTAILLCGILHAVFIFVAPGPDQQHVIYDPVLALGVLLGLTLLPLGTSARPLLVGFLALALLGNWGQLRATVSAWQQTEPASDSAGLYAQPAWAHEWNDVLARAATQRLLLLSYATGAHAYFPTVETADSWTVQPAQMLPADEARLIAKVRLADVIAQDMTSPTTFVDDDAEVQADLATRCMASSTAYFKIWTRGPCPKAVQP